MKRDLTRFLPAELTGWRRRTPMVLQSEQHECGLAALAMVAGHHGRRVPLQELRGRVGSRGATLRELMALAAEVGLHARPLRLELSELASLRCPAVLHWDLDHFVVLVGRGWRGIRIHDPAHGERFFPWSEASAHVTGVALELVPGPEFETGGSVPRMRIADFWSSSSGLMRNLLGVLVLSLGLQALALTSPFYIQLVVDEALVKHDALLLQVLLLGFAAVMLLRVGVTWVRGRLVLHAGQLVGFQMGSNLLHHLLRLPLPWFERRHLGDITSRFGSLAPVQGLITEGFAVVVVDAAMALTTLAMLFLYSPRLTAVVLGALALYALLRLATLPELRRRQQEAIIAGAEEQTVFLETLRCVGTLKAFGREADRHAQWQHRRADTVNAQVRQGRLGLAIGAANGLLFGSENLLVIWFGAHMVLDGAFTVGMLYAFIAFKGHFTDRMTTLLDGAAGLAILRLHLERLAEIGYEAPEFAAGGTPVLHRGGALLELKGVGFRFEPGAPLWFNGVHLRVPCGGLALITGPSGCGKTTLLRLLSGLVPPTEGELWVDGTRLSEHGVAAWRRRAAVVLQHDQLFTGTLGENLTFFDPEPDLAWLEACAARVGLEDVVAQLPLAWQTRIGESGIGLSGGQRQRLLLARALYVRPDALFIDEGTAHLDADARRRTHEWIGNLDMTRVVITHDPAGLPEPDLQVRLSGPGAIEITGPALAASRGG